jgi:hypothetical protein
MVSKEMLKGSFISRWVLRWRSKMKGGGSAKWRILKWDEEREAVWGT